MRGRHLQRGATSHVSETTRRNYPSWVRYASKKGEQYIRNGCISAFLQVCEGWRDEGLGVNKDKFDWTNWWHDGHERYPTSEREKTFRRD